MEQLRKKLKRLLYGRVPGFCGKFPYYGAQVHFPPNSFAFLAACEQGVYERENTILLRHLAKPGTWMFDVGANIGLMALPVLHDKREVRVISFEPSPNTSPYLRKTIDGSPYQGRWTLVNKAVGRSSGTTTFHVSPVSFDLFDGLTPNARIRGGRTVEVAMTTLDAEWNALGCPPVSVVKIDVEGWEADVLAGAEELMRSQRPSILLEWNADNLRSAGSEKSALLKIAESAGYQILTVPGFSEVADAAILDLQMLRSETFLLNPLFAGR